MHYSKKFKKNKLSRSNTRITLLEYCEKKYFLNYYTFALKKIDEALRKEAIILKKLKSLDMWMGEKTHYLISDFLKLLEKNEATEENIQKIKEDIAESMRQEFAASKERDYSDMMWKKIEGLSEHFYEENIDDELEPTIQKVWDNLESLMHSPWKEKIEDIIKANYQVYIENPKNPDFESMKVETDTIPELQDISIMASPDFWVVFSNEKYLILDRKSGKEPWDRVEISDQVKIYTLKLILNTWEKAEIGKKEIEGYEVYLPSARQYGGKLKQKDIDEIIEKIVQDTNFQKTFLIDQDPIKNRPLPSNVFSRTTSAKKCERCTFRKVCENLKNFE